jgi:hypothetical protein
MLPGALTRVPGVGSSVAAKIAEYRRTGTIKAVDELRAKLPSGVRELAKVPGVGPKRALQLARELGITSASELAVRFPRAVGCTGWPSSAPRARSASCAASPSPPATPRCATPCALPADATEDDIYAVLAAQFGPGADASRAVTDHAPNLVMQRMTAEKILAQRDQLRALADTTGMALLRGTELNIAPDGSVDWNEDFLSGFDICLASIQAENPNPKQALAVVDLPLRVPAS